MKINMEIEQKDQMRCAEIIMATVAKSFNRSYEMIFSRTWQFVLNEQDYTTPGMLNNRISSGDWMMEQLLEQYHGIRRTFKSSESVHDIINID